VISRPGREIHSRFESEIAQHWFIDKNAIIYYRGENAEILQFLLSRYYLTFVGCEGDCSGCKNSSITDLPIITIQSGDMEIGWVADKWNGNKSFNRDGFYEIMRDLEWQDLTVEDLPYIKNGEEIIIFFNGAEPDSFTVTEFILNQNGSQKYNVEGMDYDLEFHAGVYRPRHIFAVKHNLVTSLSSNSNDYLPGNTIKGYRIAAVWGVHEGEYAFIIRGDASSRIEMETVVTKPPVTTATTAKPPPLTTPSATTPATAPVTTPATTAHGLNREPLPAQTIDPESGLSFSPPPTFVITKAEVSRIKKESDKYWAGIVYYKYANGFNIHEVVVDIKETNDKTPQEDYDGKSLRDMVGDLSIGVVVGDSTFFDKNDTVIAVYSECHVKVDKVYLVKE